MSRSYTRSLPSSHPVSPHYSPRSNPQSGSEDLSSIISVSDEKEVEEVMYERLAEKHVWKNETVIDLVNHITADSESPVCEFCNDHTVGKVFCHNCTIWLCMSCDGKFHSKHLAGHVRFARQSSGHVLPSFSKCSLPSCVSSPSHTNHVWSNICRCVSFPCSRQQRIISVFDLDGERDICLDLCPHNDMLSSFVSVSLFPATVLSPKSAFTFRFLELANALQLEGNITMTALLDAVYFYQKSFVFQGLHIVQRSSYVQETLQASLHNFRAMKKLKAERGLCISAQPVCPPCSGDTQVACCIDAQFKIKNIKPRGKDSAEQIRFAASQYRCVLMILRARVVRLILKYNINVNLLNTDF